MKVVYLLECRSCSFQYIGSTGNDTGKNKFRHRFNDYKSKNKQFLRCKNNITLIKGKPIPHAALHSQFLQADRNGVSGFSLIIIDKANNLADVRKKESFWQNKLKTFLTDGLIRLNTYYLLAIIDLVVFRESAFGIRYAPSPSVTCLGVSLSSFA